MRKFLVWSYNASLAGLIAPNLSDSAKAAYVVGATVASLVCMASTALVLQQALATQQRVSHLRRIA